MEPPKYARYFACTDGSALGALALELCKKMQTFIQVRTISMTGVFVDGWFKQIHTVNQAVPAGSFINVVACDPSRWVWTQTVMMPDRDPFVAGQVVASGKVEQASQQMSLYTDGVRNVLYAVAVPRSADQLTMARQFEQVVVPNAEHQRWWKEHAQMDVEILGYPMADALVRRFIVGPDE